MTAADDLQKAVLAEAASVFPGAPLRALWTEISGDRAVTVVDVEFDSGPYTHQVASLRDGTAWRSCTSGPAPGLLEVDALVGVVTRWRWLEPGTQAVRVRLGDDDRVIEVEGDRLFQALWEVAPSDLERFWPEPVQVLIRGRWEPVAVEGVPVTAAFLVERYLAFELGRAATDWWAWEALAEGARVHPEETLDLVLRAIEAAPDERTLLAVAAGPLEDLVVEHAALLVDRLEAASAASPKLRRALAGVWADIADEAVATRIEQLKADSG